MKLNAKYLPMILGATLALGIIIGGWLSVPSENKFSANNSSKNKLNKLIDFINNEYVDNINTDSIIDLTVNNILGQLDPHSVYVPPAEQAEVAENMKGDFVGIGVSFFMYKDSVTIIKPVANGPSARAGIKAGDRILYADKTKLFGRKLPSDSLFSRLKGEKGSEVQLIIYRKSENKKLTLNVKRDIIPLSSVDASLMINKTTAYIKINRFAETTFEEFRKALVQLKRQGATALIIDLRDNGGGYMEEAIAIADELLKDKQLIVFTKNNKGAIQKTYATKNGYFQNGKVYVLINENSASASEILAGAVQDNDRGTIVGRRSFGKGLVQREMNFEDGSAVRLTIARYYTPTGRSIQKPYIKGDDETYFKESEARFASGELYEKDSIKVADSLKFKTPKGKIVYGGGGIVPDLFIPLQSEHGSENIVYLMQSVIVGNFIFEQLDQDRNVFKGIVFEDFLSRMKKTDVYFNSFQKFLTKNGLDVKLLKSKELVKRYLTAEFARQLFGDRKYYELILKEDIMIKAILK
jgi:carboxyl-terminal processing protease